MNWPWNHCRRVRRLLLEYVDRELRGEPARFVSVHLQRCAACRELASELEEGAAWAEQATPARPPEDFVGKVMARIEQLRSAPSLLSSWGRPAAALAAAALLLAVLVLRPGPRISRVAVGPPTPRPQAQLEIARASALEPAPIRVASLPAADSQETGRPRATTKSFTATPSTSEPEASAPDELAYLLGEEPIPVESYAEAGVLYEESGLLPQALSAYHEAAAQGEEARIALLAIGRIHEQMGELDAAVEAYAAALLSEEAEPESPVS